MKTFDIEVLETLSRVVTVRAADADDAISKVQDMYHNEEIVLDADDFVDAEITDINRDVVTPLTKRLHKLIKRYVTEHYGSSEARDPSWAIKPLAEALAKELA